MKKFRTIVSVIIMIFAGTLTACSSGTSGGSEVSPAPEAGSETEPEEQKPAEDQGEYLLETEFLTPDSVTNVKCSSLAMEDCTQVSSVDYDWWFYVIYETPEDANEASEAYTAYLNSSFNGLTDSRGNTMILPEHDETVKWLEFGITLNK